MPFTLHDLAKAHNVSYQAVLKRIVNGRLEYKGHVYEAYKEGRTWLLRENADALATGLGPDSLKKMPIEQQLKYQDLNLKRAREKLAVQQLEFEKKRIAEETKRAFKELVFDAISPLREAFTKCHLTQDQAQLLNSALHSSMESLRKLNPS